MQKNHWLKKLHFHLLVKYGQGSVEIWGLTKPCKTGSLGEECLLFINSYQESYLSEVGLGFFPVKRGEVEGMAGKGGRWGGRGGFWLCKKNLIGMRVCSATLPRDHVEVDFCEPHHQISGKNNDAALALTDN